MNTGRRDRSQAASWLLCFLLSLGLLLGPATTSQAQESSGTVTGTLTDPSGGVLPGVTVTLTNVQTGRVTTAVTDGSGMYRAVVEPGRYRVGFELSGFARQEMPDVNVLLGRSFTIDAQMKVGNIAEAVQVTAENAPLVDTRSTLIAHNVTAEEIDRMPKGRSFQSVAMTAPSVNSGEIEGGFQVNGASGSENQFTVDGVSTNSLLAGHSRQNTVFEYLQEVQVKTVGIPAEYGGALGGVISAVTKSGGNRFTGEGHYYLSGSALSAGPVKRLVLSPVDDRTVFTVQEDKQDDVRNEIGGSLGGPIVRDRLFFFGSLSPRFNTRTNEYLFSGGTDPGEIERKQTLMSMYGKVSYGGRRVNAYFGTLWTPTTSEGTLPAYNGIAAQYLSASKASNNVNLTRGYETDQRNLTGNVDITVSNTTFVSVKVGHFYDNYKDTGVPLTTPWLYRTPCCTTSGVPAQFLGPTNTQNTPPVQIVDHDTTKQTYFQADYNAAFAAGGFHTLKVGAGIRHNANDVDQRYPGGRVELFWDQTYQSAVPGVPPGRGTFGYYTVDDLGTFGEAAANIAHFYVQDQWSAGRLTLNLGLRLENEKIPAFRERDVAIQFGWGDKLAPRLGAAYDMFGDGRMKVFGSYGRYYDWTKYELARGTFGGDIWKTYYRALDDPAAVLNANLNSMPGRDILGASSGFVDWRIPAFGDDVFDPELKPMSQDSYSAGFEFQLQPTTVLAVNYIHNKLLRTIEDVGQIVDGSEVYTYGNPGEGILTNALLSTATTPFNIPKPTRKYDALQVSLNRRFANSWFLGGNYTLSRLYGNYAGIASSDEIRTPGNSSFGADQQQAGQSFRPGGNANRGFDLDEMMWDSNGNVDPKGRLATDRPHVLKVYGAYIAPFGTQIGLNQYVGSGTPLTTDVRTLQTLVFAEGRGDMGRTPMLSSTDLLLSHELRVGGDRRMRLELNVLNVFNQKTVRHRFNGLNRNRSAAGINLANVNLANGYDHLALIALTPDGRAGNALEPRYNMPDLWSEGAQGHVMVKFLF
jgi:Carboxypeptidase regulatory-like domain/TonB-dependent Receptor Plug Domain